MENQMVFDVFVVSCGSRLGLREPATGNS